MLDDYRIEYIFDRCISSIEDEHNHETEDNSFDYAYGSIIGVHGEKQHTVNGTVTIEFKNVTEDELKELVEREKNYFIEIGNDEQASGITKVDFDNDILVNNKTVQLSYSANYDPKEYWY
jgi:hypothetical protein